MTDVPRMLTIAETAKEFRLPQHFVRKLVLSGRVVAVSAGRKYLINASRFIDFLNQGDTPSVPQKTGIRRVE